MPAVNTDAQCLLAWAAERSYQAAWAPTRALDAVRDDLSDRLARGEIDAGFARDALPSFNFDLPPLSAGRWTALVLIVPRLAHVVAFEWGGRQIDAIIPPTYVGYRRTFEDVRGDLAAHALPNARVERLEVPLKPLATRLGLVRYGRNNVTYVSGLGSYFQIVAYITDAVLPVPDDWQPCEPRLLEECEACHVCEAVCPTGAIQEDRILLHAERCLTFANESLRPLPASIPRDAHHSVVGCLQCQQLCPANPALGTERLDVRFSEEETRALLATADQGAIACQAVVEKLARLELTESAVVGRNLQALLDAQ